MSGTDTAEATLLPPDASGPMHEVGRWIGRWLFRPSHRTVVAHRERIPATGPVVVVANHTAFMDGPLLFGVIPRRTVFLVKEEMYFWPVGPLLRRIGQLPVRSGTAARTSLSAAVGVLRAGGLVAVFPEGARGAGEVASAHHGAAWLARTGGATVVPVVIRGTRRPDGARRRFRPRVDVVVGEPLTLPEGRGRAGLVAASDVLRTELAAFVRTVDADLGRPAPRP